MIFENLIAYGARANKSDDVGLAFQKFMNEVVGDQGGGEGSLPIDWREPEGTYLIKTGASTNYASTRYGANLKLSSVSGGAPVMISKTFAWGNVLLVTNPSSNATFERFSWIGELNSGSQVAEIVNRVLAFASGLEGVVRFNDFYGIDASDSIVYADLTRAVIEDNYFYGCSAKSATNGAVIKIDRASHGVEIRRNYIQDIGQLRDFTGSSGLRSDTYAGIGVFGWANYPPIASQAPVRIEDNFVDEGYKTGFYFRPDAATPIPWLVLRGNSSNVRTGTVGDGNGIGVYVKYADRVVIFDQITTFTSNPLTPGIWLENVKSVVVRGWRTGGQKDGTAEENGAGANRLIAKSTVDYLRVEDSVYKLIDSDAKTTDLVDRGKLVRVTQDGGVCAEGEETRSINVAGSGGTGAIAIPIEHDSDASIQWRVSAAGGYEQAGVGVFKNQGGLAAVCSAMSGSTSNPDDILAGCVVDSAFGATASALAVGSAGSPTTRDKAILTVTNHHASAKNFLVSIKRRRTWDGFDPAQWVELMSQMLLAYWPASAIVDAGGGACSGVRDVSGNGSDLAPVTTATYYASAGPNNLPAFSGHMKATLARTIKQGLLLSVGSYTAVDQCHVALSSSASTYSSGGIRSISKTVSGSSKELCQRGSSEAGAQIAAILDGSFHMRMAGFWNARSQLTQDATQTTPSQTTVTMDALDKVSVGALNDGTLVCAGKIQCVAIFDQAIPIPSFVDAGSLMTKLYNRIKAEYGTP